MEKHIPEYVDNNWKNMTEVHKELDIQLDPNASYKNLLVPVAGDTDSVAADSIIYTNKGKMLIKDLFEKSVKGPLYQTCNGALMTNSDYKVLNWDEKDGIHYTNINYISKHKVTKEKWLLKTTSGKEIIITKDHSLIVFRNGKKLVVKPGEVLKSDKILSIDYLNNV